MGVGVLTVILAGTHPLGAAESGATSTNPPVMHLRGFTEKVAAQWEIQRGLITYGTNHLTFVCPAEYQLQTEVGAARLGMEYAGDARAHGHSTLTLQLYPLADYPTNAPTHKWLWEKWQKEWPDVTLTGEFTASMGAFSGPGIELRKPAGATAYAVIRQAVIVLPDCVAVVTHTASAEHAAFHQASYRQFMLSVRCVPVGAPVEFRPLVLE